MATDRSMEQCLMDSPNYLKDQEAIMYVENRFREVYQCAKDEKSSPQLMTAVLQCKEIVSRFFALELRERSQQAFSEVRLTQIGHEKDAKIINEYREQLAKQKTIIGELTEQTVKQKNIIDELEKQLNRQRTATEEAQQALSKCQAINAKWISESERMSQNYQDIQDKYYQLEKTVTNYAKLLQDQTETIETLQLKCTKQEFEFQGFKETKIRLEKTINDYSNLLIQQKKYIEDQIEKEQKLKEELDEQKKIYAAITPPPKIVNIPSLPYAKGMDCQICYIEYSTSRYPMVAPCGHSMCEPCLDQLKSFNCPFCQHADAYKTTARNYLAWEVMEETKRHREQFRKECQ